MTFAEEFSPEAGQTSATPDYPVAFGVQLTPTVGGVLCGVAGLVGAIAIVMYLIMPIWGEYQSLNQQKKEKQDQLQQQQAGQADAKIQELESKLKVAETQKPQVLALFSKEKDLNTLLLDLNTRVNEINRRLKTNKAELVTFAPQVVEEPIINDGSYGEKVNNKLKLQSYSMSLEGTFAQTKDILVDFERLQSFLVIKNLRTEVSEEPSFLFDKNKLIVKGEPKLKTSFGIDVLLPLTPEELAKIAEQNKPPEEGTQPPQ